MNVKKNLFILQKMHLTQHNKNMLRWLNFGAYILCYIKLLYTDAQSVTQLCTIHRTVHMCAKEQEAELAAVSECSQC